MKKALIMAAVFMLLISIAGCGETTVAGVLACLKQGQKKKGLLLLQGQREALLDEIHADQSCIDYLDDVLGWIRKGDT
mgnify:CR=1 FL=1